MLRFILASMMTKAPARKPRRNIIAEMMAEHIQMPGCPSLIVTREDCYFWLKAQGYETDCRKSQFGSVDYMTFRRPAVDEPLSDVEFRDRVLAAMAEHC